MVDAKAYTCIQSCNLVIDAGETAPTVMHYCLSIGQFVNN